MARSLERIEEVNMKEKLYVAVSHSAVWNLVMGIVILVTGITSGILLLVSAARLMKAKGEITF